MPPKRKNMKMKMNGAGVLSDLHKFIKDQKLISKGLGLLPGGLPAVGSIIADQLGYGQQAPRKRAPRKRAMPMPMPKTMSMQHGAGIFSDLGNGVGSIFGGIGGGLGNLAHGIFGAGKRKKKKMRGRGPNIPVMVLSR